VQLIEPIVTDHALQVLEIIVVDMGRTVGELRIAAVAVVVELEWAEALAAIRIVNEVANVLPNPLRTEIDQALEQRRITDVIEIGGLQNVLHCVITGSNF